MSKNDLIWALQQAIIAAVKHANLQRLELYLNRFIKIKPADISIDQLTRGPERNNLLHYALQESQSPLPIINMLVNQFNMDPCTQNAEGETPFYLAATKGEVEVMRLLYRANPQCSTICNHKGVTPVYAAALNNQVDSLKFLQTTCGYDLNAQNHHHVRVLDVVNETKQPQAYQFLQKEFKRYSIDLIKMCSSFYLAPKTDSKKPKADDQASLQIDKKPATHSVVSKTHSLSASSRPSQTPKTSEQTANNTKQIRKDLLRQARQAWSGQTSAKKYVRSKASKRTVSQTDQNVQLELDELRETLQAPFKSARHSP